MLDKLQLLGAGAKGGYFDNIYLNLPPTGAAPARTMLLPRRQHALC